jgi:Arc/MetJ-type ribon-helix-helix transcriptional regulator
MMIYHTNVGRLPVETTKVAITIDHALLAQLDALVEQQVYPSRSKAIQEAVRDKLARLERSRLARECAKLDPRFEQALADEALSQELNAWPPY